MSFADFDYSIPLNIYNNKLIELQEILDFISNVISITTCHYERIKEKETKVISINTSTHETKSISLHPSKYRRAS